MHQTSGHQRFHSILTWSLFATLLVAWGCAEKSPMEKIAETRAQYTVQLNAWLPQEPEVEPVETVEGGELEGAEAEGGEAEMAEEASATEEEMTEEAVEPEPRITDILFDVILYFNGNESLPGITLDITHAGADEQQKGSYRYWADTADMLKGNPRQFNFVLQIPEFETGDIFSMELRQPIPEAEIGEYGEFYAAP
ncbi:MAG: hypothetical protein GY856_42270 [bacterium]|nr:hypothetical protein [bacterium]